jgi:5-methylcytosine-specific restriction endonuclease McrA
MSMLKAWTTEKSLPKLKAKLDKVFNAFIRKRDTLPGNVFKCISCGELKHVSKMHAGHFHSAGHNEATRWVEENVNGQCERCNTFLHGNLLGYREGMLKKYGQRILDRLEIQRHNRSKMMRFEVTILIQEYKKKLKA